ERVRATLLEARARVDEVEARAREIVRRGAQLQGDAEASEAQAEELERRLQRAREELQSTSVALSDLASQGDLFAGKLDDLARAVETTRGVFDVGLAKVSATREALDEARGEERRVVDEAARIGARRSALEKLDRDQEGVEPAVRAALALGDAGVLGPLADFIEGDATLIAAAESYLGAMARALVVEDEEAVRRILRWFAEEWKGGGGLTLLPLDQVPAPDGARGPLADGIEPKGPAGAWVRE